MTLENATKQIVSWHQGVEVLPLERHEVERYTNDTGIPGTYSDKF
ncbi:hypothetical protein BTJ45_04969 [Bacillus mycoides]|nr:hypothetical protein BTJ45_04969 [Bacillus mycoides]